MRLLLKNIVYSDVVLFFCALLIGYSLWTMLNQQQLLQHTMTLPVLVFRQQTVIYQSEVNARIESTRAQLRSLQRQPPQITLYREEHPENQIAIMPGDILLPETVLLIDYWPKSVNVI
jgi:hypothetical protein